LLHGIDMLLAEELKVPVLVAENPMDCVAIGTGVMLDNIDRLPKKRIG
ncbi:MAG: rod shape-determining protein, partial [Bacillota bacterium]|nr:rod shape-determining protein [Bacillota bacterium]